MVSADEESVIVYNGEVYNFIEPRRELENTGYRFKSDCDTEVILYDCREWALSHFIIMRMRMSLPLHQTFGRL